MNAPFHRIAYNYSRVDWGSLRDWGRLSASDAASKFCERVQVPHPKYQVKPDSSPWFSAAYAAAIVYRNHFSRLYQQNKSTESKVKFRQASNHWKRVLELPNVHVLIKQRVLHFPETWLS